jgi:hypothetical protein
MSEALQALEVEATDDGSNLIELVTAAGSVNLTVKPVKKWKASGVRAMRQGDFDTWAEKALTPESYKEWAKLDPDMDEVEVFFEAWSEATGQTPKGLGPSGIASQRSPKR